MYTYGMRTLPTYNEPYLAHHGVKGMKWGVRRYQNPDGSLTAAGRLRYYKKATQKAKPVRRALGGGALGAIAGGVAGTISAGKAYAPATKAGVALAKGAVATKFGVGGGAAVGARVGVEAAKAGLGVKTAIKAGAATVKVGEKIVASLMTSPAMNNPVVLGALLNPATVSTAGSLAVAGLIGGASIGAAIGVGKAFSKMHAKRKLKELDS